MDFLQKNSTRPSKLDSKRPENTLAFLISFFERERTSVRNMNRNYFKKSQLLFGWFSSTSLKKPKSLTRQTPGCFASWSLVNQPFRKMETYCSQRNFFRFQKVKFRSVLYFSANYYYRWKKNTFWKGVVT